MHVLSHRVSEIIYLTILADDLIKHLFNTAKRKSQTRYFFLPEVSRIKHGNSNPQKYIWKIFVHPIPGLLFFFIIIWKTKSTDRGQHISLGHHLVATFTMNINEVVYNETWTLNSVYFNKKYPYVCRNAVYKDFQKNSQTKPNCKFRSCITQTLITESWVDP